MEAFACLACKGPGGREGAVPRGAGPRDRGPVRRLQESDRAGWPPGTRRKENDGTGGYALPSFPSLAHPLPPGVGARQGRGASRATEIRRGETRTGLHGGEGGGRAPQPPLSRAGGWGEGESPLCPQQRSRARELAGGAVPGPPRRVATAPPGGREGELLPPAPRGRVDRGMHPGARGEGPG